MKTKLHDAAALPAFIKLAPMCAEGDPPGGPGSPPPPPPPPPPPSPFDGLSAENKAVLDAKKFGDMNAVFDSLRNAESLIGLDKAQLLKLPADRSDAAAMREVYRQLGAPDDAAAYNLKADPDRGLDGPLFEKFPAKAVELGLLPHQVNGLLEFIGAEGVAALQANAASEETAFNEAAAAIKKEFGDANDQKLAAIDEFIKEHAGDEFFQYLEQSKLGNNLQFAKFMDKLVQLTSDGKLPNDPGRDVTRKGALSPSEANAKLIEFDKANDAALRNKSHPDHAALVEQRLKLIEQANPAPKA